MPKFADAYVDVSLRLTPRDRIEKWLLAAALRCGLPPRFGERWIHRVVGRPGRVVTGPIEFRK